MLVLQEKQMTCTDINTLTRQKELLLQKLSTFEETNRTLRDLLREQHCKEVSVWPAEELQLWLWPLPHASTLPALHL
jgi:outer dense fiber protein 2